MIDKILDISVVICAYTEERWHDLVAAVKSIQQQNLPPREIILVIDHNKQLLERAQSNIPGVTIIENIESKGLSGARNSGIARSKGILIAFLDDDAVAEADWLSQLNECCQNPQVLGAGGIVEPLWSDRRPAWFPHEFYWVIGCTYQSLSGQVTVVRNPYGGCTCIRREVFEVVGGFRNGLGRIGTVPMGGEETELCIRAGQLWPQRVFLCDPHAKIHHRISSSRAKWRYFIARCYAEGISKATITKFVGAKSGLASERTYTLFTLPKGVARGLMDGFFRFDLAGFLRAGNIITGLTITTLGYVVGSIAQYVDLSKGVKMSSDQSFKESASLK